MKGIKRALRILAALLLVAFGIGTAIFLNPDPHVLRTPYVGEQAPIDGRTGVYSDEEGHRWLVAPALSTGLVRFPLDGYGRSLPVAMSDLAGESLSRIEVQPYQLNELAIQVPDRLAGWSFEPVGPARGGIVILHGAMTSDRGNPYYIYLAHTLAETGYVVVLPDKRGSGRSEGDWRNAPLDQLAHDGAAWMRELRRRRVDLQRLGFVGVSQGGIITPQAAQLAHADFGVDMSGSAGSLRSALRHEVGNDVREGGVPKLLRPLLTWAFSLRAERKHPGFWRANANYDMLDYWRSWGGPMFIALGREDALDKVPVAQTLAMLEPYRDNPQLTWKIYDHVGHSLCDAQGRFLPEFKRDLLAWLASRTGSGRPGTADPAIEPAPSAAATSE